MEQYYCLQCYNINNSCELQEIYNRIKTQLIENDLHTNYVRDQVSLSPNPLTENVFLFCFVVFDFYEGFCNIMKECDFEINTSKLHKLNLDINIHGSQLQSPLFTQIISHNVERQTCT